MAVEITFAQQQRKNQAARIGKILDLPDAGAKISRDGWQVESYDNGALLTVELIAVISLEEANALINGQPLDESNDD